MYVNVAIVFLVSGFWHGANWTYIMWGAIHALLIIVYMLYVHYNKATSPSRKITQAIAVFVTFLLVSFAWIFFRANTLTDAVTISRNIVTGFNAVSFQLVLKDLTGAIKFTQSAIGISVVMIGLMFIVEKILPPDLSPLNKKPYTDIVFCSVILSLIILFGVFHSNSFIYFQF